MPHTFRRVFSRLHSTTTRTGSTQTTTRTASTQALQQSRNPNLDAGAAAAFYIPGVNPDPSIVHEEVTVWEDNIRDPNALKGKRDHSWWTGVKPEDCPGLRERKLTDTLSTTELTSLPALDLRAPSREAVQAYFDNTWTLTELLFAGLQGEQAFYQPPYHDLRHPMIFYYGHVASLYINKLRVSGVLSGPLDAFYEHIFETGVDEMSWDDLSKNAMKWPSVSDVTAYRREVYKMVSDIIASSPELGASKPIAKDDPLWALVMGFEHERIHLETSSVLMREMPISLLSHPTAWPADHPGTATILRPADARHCVKEHGHTHNGTTPIPENGAAEKNGAAAHTGVNGSSNGVNGSSNGVNGSRNGVAQWPGFGHGTMRSVANAMVAVSGRPVELGKPDSFPSFGWDNEYGTRRVNVPGFEAAKYMTTNTEMLQFIVAGGYQDRKYWSSEGWGWKTFRNVKHPTFFVPSGPAGLHEYQLRTIFGVRPLAECADWPVAVNLHEATAFCEWKNSQLSAEERGSGGGYRLLSEAEYRTIEVPAEAAAEEWELRQVADGHVKSDMSAADALAKLVERDAVMRCDGQQMLAGEKAQSAQNMNLAFSSESPVDALPANELGFHDVRGNMWEWCSDHFNPLGGFQPESFYQDFSTPCFDGEHHVISGGSFISTGDEASRYSRYHFRPHFFQHAGFRLARSTTAAPAPVTTAHKDESGNITFITATAEQDNAESGDLTVITAAAGTEGFLEEIRDLKKSNARLEAALRGLLLRVESMENGGSSPPTQ